MQVDSQARAQHLKGLATGARYEVMVVSVRGFEESEPLTGFFTTGEIIGGPGWPKGVMRPWVGVGSVSGEGRVLEGPVADQRPSRVWEGGVGKAAGACSEPLTLFCQFLMAPPSCKH